MHHTENRPSKQAPTPLLSTPRPAEDLEVQASKSMMQEHSITTNQQSYMRCRNTKPAPLPRNSGLRNMDLLSMHNKDSQALNFCFFWFKPKEDAPPAERRRKITALSKTLAPD